MRPHERYADRTAAGRVLANLLTALDLHDPVVIGLPRGGVPVAAEVAKGLHAPLDLVLVRKIGVPSQPELAMAAVVDGAEAQLVRNADVIELIGVGEAEIRDLAAHALKEIERRRAIYFAERAREAVEGRDVILVDDGIATGATVRAAVAGLRRRKPHRLILAVPVAARDTLERIRPEVDTVVCPSVPEPFLSVGSYYRDFHQLRDEDVVRALSIAGETPHLSPPQRAGRR